jgi:DNA-binding CsgD family transcriptional regulator
MATQPTALDPNREHSHVLEAFGISSGAEALYRALLQAPRTPLIDLARAAGLTERDARQAAKTLELTGLVSRRPGKLVTLIPTPPDRVGDVLAQTRIRAVERARSEMHRLAEEYHLIHEQADAPTDVVEVITGPVAIEQAWVHLQLSARHQIRGFDAPPYLRPTESDPNVLNPSEMDLLAKGISYRIAYAQAALDRPGALAAIEVSTAAGEEARLLPEVPMKLTIADEHVALLPLHAEGSGANWTMLLVHASPLLAALAEMFETAWNRALPLDVHKANQPDPGGPNALTAQDRQLLALIAAGLKNESIARQLGVSMRTVERRFTHLARKLNARNRVEIIMQATRRGLVE